MLFIREYNTDETSGLDYKDEIIFFTILCLSSLVYNETEWT